MFGDRVKGVLDFDEAFFRCHGLNHPFAAFRRDFSRTLSMINLISSTATTTRACGARSTPIQIVETAMIGSESRGKTHQIVRLNRDTQAWKTRGMPNV